MNAALPRAKTLRLIPALLLLALSAVAQEGDGNLLDEIHEDSGRIGSIQLALITSEQVETNQGHKQDDSLALEQAGPVEDGQDLQHHLRRRGLAC